MTDDTRHSHGIFECPIDDCSLTIIGSWGDLHDHVWNNHHLESMYGCSLTHKTLADRIQAAREDAFERDIEAEMYNRDPPDHVRPAEALRDLDWLTDAADAEPGMTLAVDGPDGLARYEIVDTQLSNGAVMIEIDTGRSMMARTIDSSVWMVVDASAVDKGVES